MVKITRTLYDERGKEVKKSKEQKELEGFRKLSPSEKIDAIIGTRKKKERMGDVVRGVGHGASSVARGVGKLLKKQSQKSRKKMNYQMSKPASSFLGEHHSDMFRRQNGNNTQKRDISWL